MKVSLIVVILTVAGCSSKHQRGVSVIQMPNLAEIAPSAIKSVPTRHGGGMNPGEAHSNIEFTVTKVAEEVDSPPDAKLPARAVLVYPRELERARIGGSVTVQLSIDTEGSIGSATVINASQREFDDAVSSRIARMAFRPAFRNGHAVPCHATCVLIFSFSNE